MLLTDMDAPQHPDQVLANQKVLENRFTKLEPEVERNSSDIKDVIKTLDFESERINSC